jgi:flagellin-like hook-associated protein FlgL
MSLYMEPINAGPMAGQASSLFHSLERTKQALQGSSERVASGNRLYNAAIDPMAYQTVLRNETAIRRRHRELEDLQNHYNLQEFQGTIKSSVLEMVDQLATLAIKVNDASLHEQKDQCILEYNLILEEILSRSQDTAFNKIDTAGGNLFVAYDQDNQSFVFSSTNREHAFGLHQRISTSHCDAAGTSFDFSGTQDFTLTKDGENLVYCDDQGYMTRYHIPTGAISRDSSTSYLGRDLHLVCDESGSLYFSCETVAGSGVYELHRQALDVWSDDSNFAYVTSNTNAMASRECAVYDQKIYYVDSSQRLVERSILNSNTSQIIHDFSAYTTPINTVKGQFAISPDGVYVADVVNGNEIRLVDTLNGLECKGWCSSGVSITDLSFDTTSSTILFRDGATGRIWRLGVEKSQLNQTMALQAAKELLEPRGSNGFCKIASTSATQSVGFQANTTLEEQKSSLNSLDIRPYTLGLARSRLEDKSGLSLEKIMQDVDRAHQRISAQGTILGLQYSRIEKTVDICRRENEINQDYISYLKDPNISEEICLQTEYQGRIMMILSQLQQVYQKERMMRTDLLTSALESLNR